MVKLRDEFIFPSDEFSPIPFWFWNGELSKNEIERQIIEFTKKGIKGFVIHPRIGIPEDIGYLSDRFMDYVSFAVERARFYGMVVILYDEGMYPSGSAHGMVVKYNPEYASRGLCLHEIDINGYIEIEKEKIDEIVCIITVEKTSENRINPNSTKLLEVNDGRVYFTSPDSGIWKVLIFQEEFTHGTIRGIHFGEDDCQKNAPLSADLLNEFAMAKFIELTHERYYSILKDYFGNTIIGMFTDEPSIMGRCSRKGMIPWTKDFLSWYLESGNSLFDLPALWFDMGESTSEKRKNYKKAINKKLEKSFYKPIFDWCESHGIALTGHPEKSDDIGFLKYFHIPGQDLVWRWVAPEDNKSIEGEHSTMAKCSSDSARHTLKRRNSNECFGCCGYNGVQWSFTPSDMKWYLDWLFVRGVNMIYPHAFFYSVDDIRRYGERPPDVGLNNLWWDEYEMFAKYIKRMCWLMTDSINTANIAILCDEDNLPWKIAKPLYQNQIEFNYLEKDFLLSECYEIEDGKIHIANQKYNTIVIEDVSIINNTVKNVLNKLIKRGVRVIIHNPTDINVGFQYEIIRNYCDVVKVIDNIIERSYIFKPNSIEIRISNVIKNGHCFYLITNEGLETQQGYFSVKANCSLVLWDAWIGKTDISSNTQIIDGYSGIYIKLEPKESIIVFIDNNKSKEAITCEKKFFLNDSIKIINNWSITRKDTNDNINMKQLIPWNTLKDMEYYSGKVRYENSFILSNISDDCKIELNLGEVKEIAELFINNKQVGCKMWKPYTFDITKFVKTGNNHIMIDVKNTMANYYERVHLDSGLIGPVVLQIYRV